MLISPILAEIMSSQMTAITSYAAHAEKICHHFGFCKVTTSKCLVKRKIKKSMTKVPNYSKYEYAEMLPMFTESNILLESELNTLECYDEYQLEAPLNTFSDQILNDNLCTFYKRKWLETAALMRKLVSFFVHHYRKKFTECVKDYLEFKKLTLDDWLRFVKENHCGDILCIYMLSLVTGIYTCVHLKDKKIWSTLQVVPLLYHELISRCEVHLVYLGFGILLRLKHCPQ